MSSYYALKMSQEDILQILNPNKEIMRKKYIRMIDNIIWHSKYDEEMAISIINKLFDELTLFFTKEYTTKEIAIRLNINPRAVLKSLYGLFEGGEIKQKKFKKGKIKGFKWSL